MACSVCRKQSKGFPEAAVRSPTQSQSQQLETKLPGPSLPICVVLFCGVIFPPWYLKLRCELWLIEKAQGFPAAARTKVVSLQAEAICMGRQAVASGKQFFPRGQGEDLPGG